MGMGNSIYQSAPSQDCNLKLSLPRHLTVTSRLIYYLQHHYSYLRRRIRQFRLSVSKNTHAEKHPRGPPFRGSTSLTSKSPSSRLASLPHRSPRPSTSSPAAAAIAAQFCCESPRHTTDCRTTDLASVPGLSSVPHNPPDCAALHSWLLNHYRSSSAAS